MPMDATEVIDQLPVLDWRAATTDRAAFLAALREASRYVGFFYLTGHGIAPEVIDGAVAASRAFFALPDAAKQDIALVRSPHFRGYSRAGTEITRGAPDWREQVDIAPERPIIPPGPDTPPWTRLQGPNQWPPALPAFRPAIEAYASALTDLAVDLLRCFAEALGAAPDALAAIHTPAPYWRLKVIRYPGREATGSAQGVGAHKDGSFLTLLLQPDAGGLQVEVDDGHWIDAAPRPGSFVVNIGELLELASDGYLRATVHRAITPDAGRDRLSLAYFFSPNLGVDIPALTLSPALAGERRGVTRDPANPLLRNSGMNALKQRLRSHPDVAAAHHADLLELFA